MKLSTIARPVAIVLVCAVCGSSVAGPPPPYPNLPQGYAFPPGYVDEFTDSTLAEGIYSVQGGTVTQRDAATYTPVGGVFAPGSPPASPPYVGEIAYPTGFAGGGAPGNLQAADFSSAGYTHLYIAMTIQLSSNYYGHSSGVNKTIYAWIHNNPCFYLAAYGIGSGTLTWQMRLQNLGLGTSAVNLPANLGQDATVTRGSWQRVELELISNTPGAFDGVARMWLTTYNSSGDIVSGPTKVAEYTNVGWSGAGQSATWNYIQWTPIWGGVGGTIPAQQYQWMDRLALGVR